MTEYDQAMQNMLNRSMKAKSAATLKFLLPNGPNKSFPVVYVTGMDEEPMHSFCMRREPEDFIIMWHYIDEHSDISFCLCQITFPSIEFGIVFRVDMFLKTLEHIAQQRQFFTIPEHPLYFGNSLAERIADKTKPILDIAFDKERGDELKQHLDIWKATHGDMYKRL